ncbi:MAG: hypothetical protein ABI921_00550 [Panacibacter sp.]
MKLLIAFAKAVFAFVIIVGFIAGFIYAASFLEGFAYALFLAAIVIALLTILFYKRN